MDINYYKRFEPFWGNWYIKREIGSGSFGKVFEIERSEMGVVYKAALKAVTIPASEEELRNAMRDEGMSRDEASKYYKGIAEFFYRECMVMASLKGYTNIVAYEDHQLHQHPDGIGWDIFIRMELLTPLSEYLENKTIDENLVKNIAIDVCNALVICKKKNIIHRDIKPANIFVNEEGIFKLGDFGVARTLESTTGASTRVGTFDYAAPEVFRGDGKYDLRADLYSLGMVMYRLLNENRHPFLPLPPAEISFEQKENAKARRMKGEKIPAPANAKELTDAILKACEYDVKDRFASAKDMKEALENPSRVKVEKLVIPNTQPEPSMAGSYQDMETVLENGTVKLMGEGGKRNASLENTINYAETKYDWSADDRDGAYKADAKEKNSWIRIALFALIPVVIIVMLVVMAKINANKEETIERELARQVEATAAAIEHAQATVNAEAAEIEGGKIESELEEMYEDTEIKEEEEKSEWEKSSGAETYDAPVEVQEPEAAKDLEVGSIIEFGNYNGNTEWMVLEVQEDNVLLLSKNVICYKLYNDEWVDITWEECTLRKWLNSDYLDEAFTDAEKSAILQIKVVNADNAKYNTNGGNDTEDKVFLLSIDEVQNYFKDDNARIAMDAEGDTKVWWMRSPGDLSYTVAFVSSVGSVHYNGLSVTDVGGAVRPALWVDVSKALSTSTYEDERSDYYEDMMDNDTDERQSEELEGIYPEYLNGNSHTN